MALLIASSIVLVTVILIVTGLAAGYLREQAIGIAETELARLDAVFAEVADRSLRNGSPTKSQPDSAALPMTELAASYRAAALGEDATVSLLRDYGTVLGQFPPPQPSRYIWRTARRRPSPHRGDIARTRSRRRQVADSSGAPDPGHSGFRGTQPRRR